MTVAASPDAALALQALQDRLDITDTLYRYASCIDQRDIKGLRTVLADELWAKYGNSEPLVGGDVVAAWIDGATQGAIWQHHLLSVYHVEVESDTAKALVYHTSHQMFEESPDTITILVARYHTQLVRTAGGWRISRLVFEIVWAEQRSDPTDYLATKGGRTIYTDAP